MQIELNDNTLDGGASRSPALLAPLVYPDELGEMARHEWAEEPPRDAEEGRWVDDENGVQVIWIVVLEDARHRRRALARVLAEVSRPRARTVDDDRVAGRVGFAEVELRVELCGARGATRAA